MQRQFPQPAATTKPIRRIVRRQQARGSSQNTTWLIAGTVTVLGFMIIGGILLVGFVNTEVHVRQRSVPAEQTKRNSTAKRASSPSPAPMASPVTEEPPSDHTQTTVGSGEQIGIPSDLMTYCAAKQEKQNWCWAACIQMVYSTQGIKVSQEDIVEETLGVVLDVPAGPQHFMDALKGWKPSQSGRKSLEASIFEGPPPLSLLTLSLESKNPVILALQYPDQEVGHGVVITAIHLEPGPEGKVLRGVTVRDPAPIFAARKGKRELSPKEFYNASWHIIVNSL
jgi:hypothetical protein